MPSKTNWIMQQSKLHFYKKEYLQIFSRILIMSNWFYAKIFFSETKEKENKTFPRKLRRKLLFWSNFFSQKQTTIFFILIRKNRIDFSIHTLSN